jgi:glycogen(starch) synthase
LVGLSLSLVTTQQTVLMLVATSVVTDTRVLREARSLVKDGLDVIIVGRNVPTDFQPPKGITILSCSSGSGLRPSSMGSLTARKLPPHLRLIRWFLMPLHRGKSFHVWAEQAYALATPLKFGVVHAHDFTALGIAHRLSQEHGVPYIYDSHEWWIGRARQYRPTPFTDRWEARAEAQWAGRAAAVITVGDSIAALMQSKRGLKKVSVIRNSFPSGVDNSRKVVTPPRGIIYAGRIDAFRELEVTMAVAERISLPICWMGEHENQWCANHVPQARKVGIEILKSQPIEAVTVAMQNAGLVFVTHSNQFESHRLALPNKLFHAVHAGVPVIATDVTELARVVRQYDIGELYEPGNSKSMEDAIARAISRHSDLISNVKQARAELSWDRDAQVLREIYAKVFSEVRS